MISGIFIQLLRESEKATEAMSKLAKELPAICLPLKDGGIPEVGIF